MARPKPARSAAAAHSQESSATLEAFAPPHSTDSSEPLGVFALWWLIAVLVGVVGIAWPTTLSIDALAERFPSWSAVFGFGGLAAIALALIERSKRDRKQVGHGFLALTAISIGLALDDRLLADQPTHWGWRIAVASLVYGSCHLLWLDDWIDGRVGPRTHVLWSTLRDLATPRWWAWASKAALVARIQEKQRASELERERQRQTLEREQTEHASALVAAQRKQREDELAASEAAQAHAVAERIAAEEQEKADNATRAAAEAAARRCAAERRVAEVRSQTEALNVQSHEAQLVRARLQAEQIDANRRFLEAAMAARKVAEAAKQRRIEAERARELLKLVEAELERELPDAADEPELAQAATA